MTTSRPPSTTARVVNGLVALAVAAIVLATYWPTFELLDLWRADLGLQGTWIGGHAQQITAVARDGPADRAGLKAGDVLEFDPAREADWVLAGYHPMPAGFTASLPVRHQDGLRAAVSLAPQRVAYLPTLNDRLAYLARLAGLTIAIAVGVFMVWARPGLMTWSLLAIFIGMAPGAPYLAYHFAFRDGPEAMVASAFWTLAAFSLDGCYPLFAMSFPSGNLKGWSRPARTVGIALALGVAAVVVVSMAGLLSVPFVRSAPPLAYFSFFAAAEAATLAAIGALVWTYRGASEVDRPRLRWALLGVTAAMAPIAIVFVLVLSFWLTNQSSASGLAPVNWLTALVTAIFMPLALGVAVLRDRVVDIQFAISRTVVYGAMSTLVLVFLAALHWLLGRIIEQSHLAFGLEGVAAIGLGLALHRVTHVVNRVVDRVLFSKHHAAEERLRQVTAALPYATSEQSIAEALVAEPARNLALASAALFYRDAADGPLRRVLAVGWGDAHAATLDADGLLSRYLQAEHAALRLSGDQQWLPAGMPDGSAQPVLAIPIVTQHVLTAVVLYGAHVNATLPDPDEVDLLEALAKAAALSHQQVRISALAREVDAQRIRNEQLEASLRVLAQGRA